MTRIHKRFLSPDLRRNFVKHSRFNQIYIILVALKVFQLALCAMKRRFYHHRERPNKSSILPRRHYGDSFIAVVYILNWIMRSMDLYLKVLITQYVLVNELRQCDARFPYSSHSPVVLHRWVINFQWKKKQTFFSLQGRTALC